MRDTTNDAEQARLTAIRAIEPAQRLRNMFDHSEFVRRLAMAGLRRRNAMIAERGLAPRSSLGRLDNARSRPAAP